MIAALRSAGLDLRKAVGEAGEPVRNKGKQRRAACEGLIVVDGRGAIVGVDVFARRLLATNLAIKQRGGVLSMDGGLDGMTLPSLLRQARESEDGGVSLVHGGLELNVTVMRRPGTQGTRLFAVRIAPHEKRLTSAERLRAEYRLSPTEAKVAVLLGQGFRLPQIADSLRITLSTVRVHLRRIFKKTGVRRQAAVVRLVMAARTLLVLASGVLFDSGPGL